MPSRICWAAGRRRCLAARRRDDIARPAIAGGTQPKEVKQDATAKARSVAELTVVRLGKPVETKQGTVPAGSSGTVVHAYRDGQAYIIEFHEPFHAVATVEAGAIAA
jgi:hypothetical protein